MTEPRFLKALMSWVAIAILFSGCAPAATPATSDAPVSVVLTVPPTSGTIPETVSVEVRITLKFHCETISAEDYVSCTSFVNDVSIFAAGVDVTVTKNGVSSGKSFRMASTDVISVTVCGKAFAMPSMVSESEKQRVEILQFQC